MTDYTKPKFSVAVGSDAYRENWERTFGKKEEPKPEPKRRETWELCPVCGRGHFCP